MWLLPSPSDEYIPIDKYPSPSASPFQHLNPDPPSARHLAGDSMVSPVLPCPLRGAALSQIWPCWGRLVEKQRKLTNGCPSSPKIFCTRPLASTPAHALGASSLPPPCIFPVVLDIPPPARDMLGVDLTGRERKAH